MPYPVSYASVCDPEAYSGEARTPQEECWRRDGYLSLPHLLDQATTRRLILSNLDKRREDILTIATGQHLTRLLEMVSPVRLAADLTPVDELAVWHSDRSLDRTVRASLLLILTAPEDPDCPQVLEYCSSSHRLGHYNVRRAEPERIRTGERAAALALRLAAREVERKDWRAKRWQGRPGDALLWSPDLIHRLGPRPPVTLVLRFREADWPARRGQGGAAE